MHFLQAINSDISVCNKTGGRIKGDIKKKCLTHKNVTSCTQSVFLLRSRISLRETIIYIYSIKRAAFIIEMDCLLCGANWIFKYKSRYFHP